MQHDRTCREIYTAKLACQVSTLVRYFLCTSTGDHDAINTAGHLARRVFVLEPQ